MARFSLSVDDDSCQVTSDNDIQSIFKIPFLNEEPKDMLNTVENKCLIRTTEGHLLWISYSVDSGIGCDSAPSVFLLNPKEPSILLSQEDGNILAVSSFDNLSVCEDQVVDDDDINTDDILKVEDRVKVFDAILAPIEKKVKPKARVSSVEENEKFGNYICDLCGSSFVKAVQYYGHLHLHSGEFLWECRLCPESSRFTSQSQLRRHEKRYHVNHRPHACSECSATFDRPSQLDYHKRRIHEGERSHVCQLCGKAFFKRSDLRTHLNTHLSVHGCMCEICGRRFSHISNLTRHIRIHSGIKPYPCSICGRRFNQLNSLNEHKASHINETPISCCGKLLKNHVMIKKHLKLVHHADNLLSQETNGNKRRFHCKVCGNSFPFLTLLRKHEMTHDQFTCSSCNQETKSAEELKNHSCNKTITSLGEIIFDRDIDRLGDVYLDGDTDWIDPHSISESQLDKFNETDSPLTVQSLSCDNLDEAKALCYTESQVDKLVEETCFTESQVDKLVEETCFRVTSDDSSAVVEGCLEIDSLITPIPPSSPSIPQDAIISTVNGISVITPEDSTDSVANLICEPFESSAVFDQSMPAVDDNCLDGYALVQSCNSVTDCSSKCILNENITNGDEDNNCSISLSYIKDDSEAIVNDIVTRSLGDVICSSMSNVNDNADESSGKISLIEPDDVCVNKDNGNNDICDSAVDGNDTNNNCPSTEQVIDILKTCYIKNDGKEKPIKKYSCSVCGKQFHKASNFRQHQGIHDVGRQLHRCKVCGRSFAWKSTLNKHALSHTENPNPALFPCNFCEKLYTCSSLLQAHINRDHLKQRPHVCSICKKSFFKKYDLKIHFRTHTNERPYICGTCGKGFGHISHLIRHERIHSGQRPYQCSYCPASFIQSTSLVSHQKSHVKEPEPERALCYLEFVIDPPETNEC